MVADGQGLVAGFLRYRNQLHIAVYIHPCKTWKDTSFDKQWKPNSPRLSRFQ